MPSARSKTPLIAGGIIGALIGNQFGSGRGRAATTIAGTALGASLGADVARGRREQSVAAQCETTSEVREYERITGYRVTYRYAGHIYNVETATDPGEYIRLRLSPAAS